MPPTETIDVRVARLEERSQATNRALDIAAEALKEYKAVSNEWRAALSDQRTLYITRSEVIAITVVAMTILGTILHYAK